MKIIWLIIATFVILIVGMLSFKILRSNLDYEAVAQAEIAAPADEIYRQLAVLENWSHWSPFIPANAPDVTLAADEQGPLLSWTDPRGGPATLQLTATDSVAGQVDFRLQSPVFPPMLGTLQVKPVAESRSAVIWTASGSLPNTLFYRLLSENYGESLGGQLQQSLERLRTHCETPTESAPSTPPASSPPASSPPAN